MRYNPSSATSSEQEVFPPMTAHLIPARTSFAAASEKIRALANRVTPMAADLLHLTPQPAPAGKEALRWFTVDAPLAHEDEIEAAIAAIVAALREALDQLVVGLSIANGSTDARAHGFPIAETETSWRAAAAKSLTALDAAQQARIAILKPWRGGNTGLYQLEVMNRSPDGRRLTRLLRYAGPARRSQHAAIRRLSSWPSHLSPFPDRAAIAVDADADIELAATSVIGFAETGREIVDQLLEFEFEVGRALQEFG